MAIQNPGSALGEAIGARMEEALNVLLGAVADQHNCHFISKGPLNEGSGKHRKLLLYDDFATAYNIDSVIANESLQPLVLIESKYIRYKKHNRDKGSWVCHTHQVLRKRYRSIRSSIAVLAGNWSTTSQTMMRSSNVNLFLIPFQSICDFLSEHDIDFDWGEKDRVQARKAWSTYSRLSNKKQSEIGRKMVELISSPLSELVGKVLDPRAVRELDGVSLEIHTNLGEVKTIACRNIGEAIAILKDFDFDLVFNDQDAIRLTDPPPMIEED